MWQRNSIVLYGSKLQGAQKYILIDESALRVHKHVRNITKNLIYVPSIGHWFVRSYLRCMSIRTKQGAYVAPSVL
jgi:hypothetical protein